MKCRYCGSEISDNANFCTNCGAKVESENFYQQNADTKTKTVKGKNVLARLGILLAVIIVIGVLIALFLPKIQMAVLGESEYYFYKEAKNISSLVSAETIEDLRHPESYSAQSVITADYSGDEYVSALLSTLQATANVDYDSNTATVKSSLALAENGNQMFTLNGNYKDSKFIIGADYFDTQLVFDNPFLMGNTSDDNLGFGSGSGSSDDEYTQYVRLMGYLSQVDSKELLMILKNISSEYIDTKAEKSKTDVDGKSVDVISFKLSGSDIDEIFLKLTDEISNNSKLAPIAEDILSYFYDITLSEFRDELADAELFASTLNEFTFSYAYDFRGNIAFRQYIVDFGTYTSQGTIYSSYKNSEISNLNAEIIPDTDYSDVYNFSINKEVKNNEMNIEINYDDSYTVFQLSVDNMKSEKCGGVPVLIGNCNVKLSTDGESAFSVNLSAYNNEGSYDISVNLDLYDDQTVTGLISTQLSTRADVSGVEVPSEYETDIFEYLSEYFNDALGVIEEYYEYDYDYGYDYDYDYDYDGYDYDAYGYDYDGSEYYYDYDYDSDYSLNANIKLF